MNLHINDALAHKSLLCRVCASNSKDPLISIYCGGSNNFALKIMFYLPIKVVPNDGLPLKLCTSCLDNILKWDDFYQTCVDADKRLRSIFFQKDVLSGRSTIAKKETRRKASQMDEYSSNCGKLIVEQIEQEDNKNTLFRTIGEAGGVYARSRTRRSRNHTNANIIAESFVIKEEVDINTMEDVIIGEEVSFDDSDEMSPSASLPMTEDEISAAYPNFICPDCGISFLHKEKLAIHSLEVHHKHHALQSLLRQQLNTLDEMHILKGAKVGTNSYRCKHCKRLFASPSKLKVHARTHTGERPFKCLLCDKSFRQTCHTVTHMKLTHFNIRRYECKICHKHFKVRSNYRFHMRTHKGENAFDICFDDLC